MDLEGWSWAALKTCFYIPQMRIMLDAGLPFNGVPGSVFLTHTHSDHSNNLHLLLVNPPPEKIKIFVPTARPGDTPTGELVSNYIESLYRLSTYCHRTPKALSRCEIIECKSGTTFEMEIRKKRMEIRVIRCYHTVPCVGYGFTELRRKLKDEYLGMEGKEIGKLRKEGVDIYRTEPFPFFCYLGDSTAQVFEDSHIFNYPTIITECTFLLPEHYQEAIEDRHTHWNDIYPIIASHPENRFVLYHFSCRYKASEINDFFKKYREELPNLVVWVKKS